jgi:hypothetical protein
VAVLTIPRRFGSQPQYAVEIDKSNRLGAKITAAFGAHHGDGGIEVITGRKGAKDAGPQPVNQITPKGFATKAGTVNGGLSWPATPAFCDSASDFSIEVLFRPWGASTTFDRLFDFGGNTSSGGWDLEVDNPVTGLNFTTWNGATPSSQLLGSSVMTTNQTTHLVVTRQGTSFKAYINGVLANSWTATVTTATKTSVIWNASSTSGGNVANCSTLFFRFYNGTVLTPEDAADLYANMWQVYRAPSRRCVAIVAGGGGGGSGGAGGSIRQFPVTSAQSFPTVAQRKFPVN